MASIVRFENAGIRLAKNLLAIGTGNDGMKIQLPILQCCRSSDGNLAPAAKAIEQRTFTSSRRPGRRVIEKIQLRPRRDVAGTNFDGQRHPARQRDTSRR